MKRKSHPTSVVVESVDAVVDDLMVRLPDVDVVSSKMKTSTSLSLILQLNQQLVP